MSEDKEKTDAQSLPRRFYQSVGVATADHGYSVLLDDRPLLTPGRNKLILPTEPLAEAVGDEWDAQEKTIDPMTMPMTRLANTAFDLVTEKKQDVIDDVAAYAGSDLICYRAEEPDELVMKQMAQWDPILDWAADALGAEFDTTMGINHIKQPPEAVSQIRRAIEGLNVFALTAVHNMTTLTGSALLVLAHISGRFDAITCWQTAHVDEDWQISKWGFDAEAKERREKRWQEMEASSKFYALSNDTIG